MQHLLLVIVADVNIFREFALFTTSTFCRKNTYIKIYYHI